MFHVHMAAWLVIFVLFREKCHPCSILQTLILTSSSSTTIYPYFHLHISKHLPLSLYTRNNIIKSTETYIPTQTKAVYSSYFIWLPCAAHKLITEISQQPGILFVVFFIFICLMCDGQKLPAINKFTNLIILRREKTTKFSCSQWLKRVSLL